MPNINVLQELNITSSGGTERVDVFGQPNIYVIKGSATLTSNYTISPTGTPVAGTEFRFKYEANINLDGNTITIFGKTLPIILSDKTHEIIAYFDGSNWEVNFNVDIDENGTIPLTALESNGYRLLPSVSETMINGDASPIVVNSSQAEGTTQSKLYYKCNPYSKSIQIIGVVDVVSVDETAVSGSLSVEVIQFTSPDNVTSDLGLFLNIPLIVEYQTSGTTLNQSGASSPTFKSGYLQKGGTFAIINFRVDSADLGTSTTARYSAYVDFTIQYQ